MNRPYNENGVRFRPATGADIEDARRLLASLKLPVEGLDEQFDSGYVIGEATVDGKREMVAMGGVEVYGTAGLIRSVAVAPRYQRGAIGRALVNDRLEWARERGLDAVYLLTETAPGFFEKIGFRRVARDTVPDEVKASKEFAEVCPESAVAMMIDL